MGVDIPKLKSCCCMSLRTGSFIYGVVDLFLFLLYVVGTTIGRMKYADIRPHLRYASLLGELLYEQAEFLQLLFCAILVFGIVKEKSSFVAAWLISQLTRLIDTTWSLIVTSMMFFHIGFILEEFIITAFDLLGAWLVYSYYCSMSKNNYAL